MERPNTAHPDPTDRRAHSRRPEPRSTEIPNGGAHRRRARPGWYGHRHRIGRLGEDLAVAFLRRRGCVVLERNLDVGRGELDVVARGPGGSFVVEVKTGVGGDAQPEEAFDPDKAQQVRDLAGRLPGRIDRVDLITVQLAPEGVRIWWTPHAG